MRQRMKRLNQERQQEAQRKLTPRQARLLRRLRKEGWSIAELSRMFQISPGVCSNIATGKGYAWL